MRRSSNTRCQPAGRSRENPSGAYCRAKRSAAPAGGREEDGAAVVAGDDGVDEAGGAEGAVEDVRSVSRPRPARPPPGGRRWARSARRRCPRRRSRPGWRTRRASTRPPPAPSRAAPRAAEGARRRPAVPLRAAPRRAPAPRRSARPPRGGAQQPRQALADGLLRHPLLRIAPQQPGDGRGQGAGRAREAATAAVPPRAVSPPPHLGHGTGAAPPSSHRAAPRATTDPTESPRTPRAPVREMRTRVP